MMEALAKDRDLDQLLLQRDRWIMDQKVGRDGVPGGLMLEGVDDPFPPAMFDTEDLIVQADQLLKQPLDAMLPALGMAHHGRARHEE